MLTVDQIWRGSLIREIFCVRLCTPLPSFVHPSNKNHPTAHHPPLNSSLVHLNDFNKSYFNIHISSEQTKIEKGDGSSVGGDGGSARSHLMEPAYCEFLLSRVLF